MHKSHLVGCAVGITIALGVVALTGGSAGSFGVLIAALICPLVLVAVMWFLMRSQSDGAHDHDHVQRAKTTDAALEQGGSR